jgi:epoxyqueuosine reductase QueG
MMTANRLKKIAAKAGADLCGIAPVSRFSQAPPGFGPADIWGGARSVVVVAKRVPEGAFLSENPVPYTFACDTTVLAVSRLICDLSVQLEDAGVSAVPVPSEPYVSWDDDKREGRGILSLKHAGRLAGLGTMGENTILAHPVLGNRITLGAVLVDVSLEPDPVVEDDLGCEGCGICVESCPAGAIGDGGVNQKRCRAASTTVTKKGYALYTCRACRSVCPSGGGLARSRPDPKR